MQLDGALRRLYKHTDGYLRAVHSMCETSRQLAEDFAEALDNPSMREATEQFSQVMSNQHQDPHACDPHRGATAPND